MRPVSSRSAGVAGGKSKMGLTGPAMSIPTTSAPARASATAAARPIPRAAPVTTATRPDRASDVNVARAPVLDIVPPTEALGGPYLPRRPPARLGYPDANWQNRPDAA